MRGERRTNEERLERTADLGASGTAERQQQSTENPAAAGPREAAYEPSTAHDESRQARELCWSAPQKSAAPRSPH